MSEPGAAGRLYGRWGPASLHELELLSHDKPSARHRRALERALERDTGPWAEHTRLLCSVDKELREISPRSLARALNRIRVAAFWLERATNGRRRELAGEAS
jgi:hypothetical protein